MPELPEVETVRRGLERLTRHHPIWGGDVLLPRAIARPGSYEEFLDGLTGSAIADWHRRGKYLLARLYRPDASAPAARHPDTGSAAGWLGVHLRMSGQLLWLARSEPLCKHVRVRLFFPDARELRFVDARTFGRMWWVPSGVPVEAVITGLQRLGPEPFADEFSPEYLLAASRGRERSIKAALLDQSLLAGIGNIYADEALFQSRIHPATRSRDLTGADTERLHAAILSVLETAIARGGTTFNTFSNLLGVNGNYKHEAWTYGREDEPCRVCATTIVRIKLAGRSAHFCPKCQPAR
ncbi:formamidopyrimidine-DNA glycosylase (fpg) [Rubidibacter lacunae KORDI 51-2]|uniref:Formamidopyrimidine-DNA glycosylase n=1 Tax=Rubidibacter lacunae KORDI 51-2 TaxID=582515 RepID=U5DQ88_9CHRO|nr:DNA-formamidopyrimidine glycosylase [Rubidibacter lacunae]ERN43012.1 formamidopyrimidine-DNA glycosylase (fpg) [Rubidibacter lacunae KORDI 51-2]